MCVSPWSVTAHGLCRPCSPHPTPPHCTQAQLGDGKVDTADLFRDLSAYLTLERAEKQSGFQAAAYGLTDQQAADVAVVFNQYDTNQDGKLDVPEMQRLWCAVLCSCTLLIGTRVCMC